MDYNTQDRIYSQTVDQEASKTTKDDRARLLALVQVAQESYWSALADLEKAYDSECEIDSTRDFNGVDIETLEEEMQKEYSCDAVETWSDHDKNRRICECGRYEEQCATFEDEDADHANR